MPHPADRPLLTGFWNLENLFEPVDAERTWPEDPELRERLERWLRGWTEERLQQKLDGVAEVVAGLGQLDLLGLCEVETGGLLERLLAHPRLAELSYAFVHDDGPDKRGIDVALLYDPRRLQLESSETFPVRLHFSTREILYAGFLVDGDLPLDVYVNHWPSRTGGRWATEPYRIAAAEQLAWLLTNHRPRPTAETIVLGDFNDEPHCRSLVDHLDASPRPAEVEEHALHNPWWPLLGQPRGGSYLRGETWCLLDQIMVTRGLRVSEPRVVRPASMTGPDGGPQRFRRTDGVGVSDHFPIRCLVTRARPRGE